MWDIKQEATHDKQRRQTDKLRNPDNSTVSSRGEGGTQRRVKGHTYGDGRRLDLGW